MKKSLFIGITFMLIFTLSSIIPFAWAQNSGQGYQSSSIEEQIKLAREKVIIMESQDFHNLSFFNSNPLFLIIPVIIVCGVISFAVLVKSRRISSNKTKNGIQ